MQDSIDYLLGGMKESLGEIKKDISSLNEKAEKTDVTMNAVKTDVAGIKLLCQERQLQQLPCTIPGNNTFIPSSKKAKIAVGAGAGAGVIALTITILELIANLLN